MDQKLRPRTESTRLVVIVLVGFLAHFGYFLLDPSIVSNDTPTYLAAAENMLKGHGFYSAELVPETRRTPTYPVFLAAFMALSLDLEYVIIAQHMMVIGLALALYAFALRATKNAGLSLVAAIVFAIDPVTIFFTNKLLTETLFTVLIFMTCWTAYGVTTGTKNKHLWLALVGGLIGGMAALTRPIALWFFAPLAVYFMLTLGRRGWLPALLCSASFVILPSVWMYRNYQQVGVATISTISADSLLFYRAGGALAIEDPGDYDQNLYRRKAELKVLAADYIREKTGKDVTEMSHAEKSTYYRQLGKKIILEHPLGMAKVTARGFLLVLLGGQGPIMAVTRLDLSTARAVTLCWTVPCCILAILGLFYHYRHNRNLFMLALVTLGYFIILSSGGESEGRFRVPVMPFYALAIAGGCWFIRDRIPAWVKTTFSGQ